MTSIQHTSGPWRLTNGGETIRGPRGDKIGFAVHEGADANLMVCAPDLAHALELFMLPSTEKTLRDLGFKSECDTARAALNKMKGI